MIDIENGVKIKYWVLDDMEKNDKRFDDRLYDALKVNGILKE
jgi:hypothetical protein